MTALQQATAAIEEGSRMLKARQKSNPLADQSKYGWSVVTEYNAEELAEDSNDERKMKKQKRPRRGKKHCSRRSILWPTWFEERR